jgi:thymidylate synthase ThyX
MLQYVVDDNYTEAAAILHEKHYRLYSEIDVRDVEVELRKAATVEVFTDILTKIEHAYARLTSIWEVDLEGDRFGVKKTITSMMRRILPLGICTGVVYTFNLRALRNIFEQRISPGAEEEIVGVAAAIARDVIQQEPDIFCDFINLDGYWIPKEMSDAAANKKMFAVNKYHKV